MKVLSKFQMLLIIFMTILLFTGVIITNIWEIMYPKNIT